MRGIAYRLQELEHGGLSKATRRTLKTLAKMGSKKGDLTEEEIQGAIGDIDLDGVAEVVGAYYTAVFAAEMKSSTLDFVVNVGHAVSDAPTLGDLDLDGDLDILSIGWGHNNVLLYENNPALVCGFGLKLPNYISFRLNESTPLAGGRRDGTPARHEVKLASRTDDLLGLRVRSHRGRCGRR